MPPKKGKGRGWLIAFLVVVVLVAAVGGTGAWFLLGWGKGRVLWTQEFTVSERDTQNYLATWSTDEYLVRAQLNSVMGLDPAGGTVKWKVPIPDPSENLICASSSVSSDGIAVLAYGELGHCTDVFAVDMKQGKLLWEKPLKGDTRKEPHLAVSGGTVVVNNANAYRMRDGSLLWQSSELAGGEGCSAGVYGGGAKLVRTQACEIEEDEFGVVVSAAHVTSEIEPQTGEVQWSYRAKKRDEKPALREDGDVLSTSPIVVRETESEYRVLNDAGEPQGLVNVKGGKSMGQYYVFHGGSPSPAVTSSGNTLLVEQNSKSGRKVEAFALSTGERLWSTTGPSEDVRYDIVQGDDERLLAVKYDDHAFTTDQRKHPFSLVEFDPATGEETEIQDYEGVGDDLGGTAVPYLFGDRLIMASAGTTTSVGEFAEDGLGITERHDLSLVALET